jgi:hypothetical protein
MHFGFLHPFTIILLAQHIGLSIPINIPNFHIPTGKHTFVWGYFSYPVYFPPRLFGAGQNTKFTSKAGLIDEGDIKESIIVQIGHCPAKPLVGLIGDQ